MNSVHHPLRQTPLPNPGLFICVAFSQLKFVFTRCEIPYLWRPPAYYSLNPTTREHTVLGQHAMVVNSLDEKKREESFQKTAGLPQYQEDWAGLDKSSHAFSGSSILMFFINTVIGLILTWPLCFMSEVVL